MWIADYNIGINLAISIIQKKQRRINYTKEMFCIKTKGDVLLFDCFIA